MFTHPTILAQATAVPINPALSQSTGATFASTVGGLMGVINALVWLMGGIAILVFLYGCVRFIANASDTHAHAAGYKMMTWGLVALFVFFSLGGLIQLMRCGVFGSATACYGFNDAGDTNVPGGTTPFQPGPGNTLQG